eukprot:7186104-Pyramimonas_sp.AAC.1
MPGRSVPDQQSARSCRILQGQGRTDPGLGAGSCSSLQGPAHGPGLGCRTLQDPAGSCKA